MAWAQAAEAPRVFDVAAGTLEDGLNAVARQAGITLSFDPALVRDRRASALEGSFTPSAALRRLLEGSGLETVAEGGVLVLRRAAPPVPAAAERALPEVRVRAAAEPLPGEPPKPYAGGQVARGGRIGLLGDQDYMDTPFGIVAFTEERIRNLQATRVADVLSVDPSFRNAGDRTGVFEQFFVRGFLYFGTASIDGLFGLEGSRGPYLESFERMELLKGPSAMLSGGLGSGNVGGTLTYVSKKAGLEPLRRVELNYESDRQVRVHADIGQRFGPDAAFGIRTNLVASDGDLHYGQDLERRYGSLMLDYAGERVRAFVTAVYSRREYEGAGATTLVERGLNPEATPPKRYDGTPYAVTYGRELSMHGRVEVDLAEKTTASLAYGERRGRQYFYSSNIRSIDPDTGDAVAANAIVRQGSRVKTGQARMNTRFDTGPVSHRVAVEANAIDFYDGGAFGGESAPFDTNIFDPVRGPAAPAVASPVIPRYALIRSFGVADTLGFWDDRLRVTAGVRRQDIRTYATDEAGRETTAYDESANSPAVAALFRIDERFSVYGNAIQALEQGPVAPLNDGLGPGDPGYVVNPGEVFPPYKSKGREIGLKFDGGRLGATVALFQIEQPGFFVDPDTQRYGPIGEQRNRGLELNVFGEPRAGVRLLGGYAYTRAQLTRAENPAQSGNDVPGVPRHVLTLDGEWDVPALLPGLTLTGRAYRQSSAYTTADNDARIPAWTVFNLGLRYTLGGGDRPFTLRAAIDNVTDKNYYATASRGIEFGQPRTVFVSVSTEL